MRSANMLDTRRGRFAAFGILYISEGVPYGFSSTAMVMFMRMEGLSIAQVGGFAAAILLPWGFKWAVAPLIDIIKLDRLGGRKAWILACTTMMIVTLVAMALVDFVAHYQVLVAAVLLNNLFCATQDVAIDSLAVSTLKDDERGTGNGFMFGGQYLGIALGGGGAIYASTLGGMNVALMYVSALMGLSLLFVLVFIRDPFANRPRKVRNTGALAHFVATLGAFVRNLYIGFAESGRGPKFGLVFAFLPIGSMALAYALLQSMQVDYGLDASAIAQLAVLNTMSAGAGCLIGGILGDRFGIRKTMGTFYVLTTLPTLYLASQITALGLSGIGIQTFYAIIITHGLLFGCTFSTHAAIFMGMTSPAVAATQFTAYMALSNLAISTGNLWQGLVAEVGGYATALVIDALLAIATLAIFPFLTEREEKVAAQTVAAARA